MPFQLDNTVYSQIRPTNPVGSLMGGLQAGEQIRKMRTDRKLRTREEKYRTKLAGLAQSTGGNLHKMADSLGEYPLKQKELRKEAVQHDKDVFAHRQKQMAFGGQIARKYLALPIEEQSNNFPQMKALFQQAQIPGLENFQQYTPEAQGYLKTLAQSGGIGLNKGATIVPGVSGELYRVPHAMGGVPEPIMVGGKHLKKGYSPKLVKGEDETYEHAPGGTSRPLGIKPAGTYKKAVEKEKISQNWTKISQAERTLAIQEGLAPLERLQLLQKVEKGRKGFETAKRKAMDGISIIKAMIGDPSEGIEEHEGFQAAVGTKILNWQYAGGFKETPLQGTPAADFMALYDQVNGKAFLEAFQSIKGGGHITEIEGQKATEAIHAMRTATSESEFKRQARKFIYNLELGIELKRKEAERAGDFAPVKKPNTKTKAIKSGKGLSAEDEALIEEMYPDE